MPNVMYRNDAGRRFQNVTYSGGFGHLQKGHGIAFGDLDNDGDQDVFEQMGGAYPGDAYPSVLYHNPGHGNAWISLELVGRTTNRSAIGARIEVDVEESPGKANGASNRTIYATVGTGGSFGGSSLRQEIGLGDIESIAELRVVWPTSNTTQVFDDVEPGGFYEIREGDRTLHRLIRPKITLEGT